MVGRLARRWYRGGRDRRRGDREPRLWLWRVLRGLWRLLRGLWRVRGLRRLWGLRKLRQRLRRLSLRRLWLFGLCAAALALHELFLRTRPGHLRIRPGLFRLWAGLLRAPALHRLWRLPRLW